MDFSEHLKKYLSEKEIKALLESLNNNMVQHALVLNL